MSSSTYIKKITSQENLVFKSLKALTQSKEIKKNHEFILSGLDIITEFLNNYVTEPHLKLKFTIKSFIFNGSPEDISFQKEVLENKKWSVLFTQSKIQILELIPHLFKEVDLLGTKKLLLHLAFVDIKPWNPMVHSRLQVLCPLGDPQNLGALARSLFALTTGDLILLKESAHPYSQKALKASAGALLYLPIYLGPSIKEISNSDQVLALDMNGQDIKTITWPENIKLLIGEEGAGLPKGKTFNRISIPMNKIESLNASVAASIIFWEIQKNRTN